MADTAIEFVKDHEWELNGVKKTTLKGTRMIGDSEFLGQFIKSKVAKDIKQKLTEVKESLNKLLEQNEE
jgi:hypothetical protein